ncbi:hypothetical protein LY474_00105 [Myxococcus stipitatus]|uniref:hypothetical protein n=1 Tax=Myxococcus stipitatus TaxID=83455 RepID=UPI001F2F68CB|nr:hypothetical protein [Myxococcus stipitatus]MCE9666204.1 hypothetical protein [Myxococcus stipitatus]
MKLALVLGVVGLAGCATVPVMGLDDGSGGSVALEPHPDAEPVRLQTRVGSFLVHPNNADDFARALAGEPTEQRYTSGLLMAGD